MCVLVTQSCPTLWDPMDCSQPGSSVHGDSPGRNTQVGCHTLLQGVFPTQGSNPGLPHGRHILYHLSHQGSQKISSAGKEGSRVLSQQAQLCCLGSRLLCGFSIPPQGPQSPSWTEMSCNASVLGPQAKYLAQLFHTKNSGLKCRVQGLCVHPFISKWN